MSDTSEWPWTDATPPMPLADALDLASRRSGRPIAEVWSATYISATQLKQCLLEDPSAATSGQRFDPHWRIQFAGQEAVIDDGDGPGYTFRLGHDDDVLVFGDGVVMTFFEQTDGA